MKFEERYKEAITLLNKNIKEEANRNKPLIPHLLRVGKYLHDNGYSETVVNAGLLHDLIEWTDNPEEIIKEKFGEEVYEIVLANTKDRSIQDKTKRRKDYVERCKKVGISALIVKAADTVDSYNYYSKTQNINELQRSTDIAVKILENVDNNSDQIFEKLEEIL